jgi:hypothetical protein
VPWNRNTLTCGGIPLATSARSSADTLADPIASTDAPNPVEFAHPVGALESLPHGQAVPVPSPKQYAVPSSTVMRGLSMPVFHGPTG